jgi:hypothetical protein
VHGTALLALPLAGLAATCVWRSPWPLLLVAALLLAIMARTALRVGWKSRDPLTRWLYAAHSHLQQIPILLGQLAYHRDQRDGRRRRLIEYKAVR